MAEPVLIVGLGNPGPKYESTRHNVGFMVLDAFADELGVRFTHDGANRADVATGQFDDRRVILVKPTTFMNLSGESVGPLARYYKVSASDVIVVHDEVDLPVCELRSKRGGGTGGHNGLKSLVQHLGTNDFIRLRFGVGRPPGRKDTATHVLEPFNEKEWTDVAPTIGQAVDQVKELVVKGIEEIVAAKAQAAPTSSRIKLITQVAESIEAVWDRWTTSSGATTFFGPAANIGAARGEPYEIFFNPTAPDGERGNEGGTIVTIDAPKRLAFTWNAPPEVPTLRAAGERTRVSVTFKRKGPDATLVTLTHTGFGDGEDHDSNRAYFEEAWPVVLSRLEAVCAGGKMDWATAQIVMDGAGAD